MVWTEKRTLIKEHLSVIVRAAPKILPLIKGLDTMCELKEKNPIATPDAEIGRRRVLTLLLTAAMVPMAARVPFAPDLTLDITVIDGWILRASDLKDIARAL
jgi:hypothetical protein